MNVINIGQHNIAYTVLSDKDYEAMLTNLGPSVQYSQIFLFGGKVSLWSILKDDGERYISPAELFRVLNAMQAKYESDN